MSLDEIREKLRGCEILIVPYCHSDWAWTHTRAWHEARYVRVFEQVLELMREDPDFRWYLDSWVTQLQPFLDHRPDLVPELQQRVREGRIAICGGFANVRPNMVGEETFLRSIIHGRRRFRQLFPEADLTVHADIVDVSLGHPQVPQIMRLAGYRYFRAWRPQAGLSEAGLPYEWVWEGLNGSQILCSRGCYGGLSAPDTVPDGYADSWEATVEQLWQRELELGARHNPTDVIWVSQGMDDGLPLRSFEGDIYQDLPGVMREWNAREQSRMRFATPVEFYAELEARRERIPVVKGTLDPCDVCYNAAWGGGEGLWRKRFVADEELVKAESWGAVASSVWRGLVPRRGGAQAPALQKTDFSTLWENALICSAHATQWLFQQDFDELDEVITRTILQARQAGGSVLSAIARRVPQPENTAAIVFNSLPFERTEVVPVLATGPHGLPGAVKLVDGGGQEIPSQQVTPYEYPGRVWEADLVAQVTVPAMGYTTVRWEPAEEAPPGNDQMDNGLLKLSFADERVAGVEFAGSTLSGSIPWGSLRLYEVDTNGPLHCGPIKGTMDAVFESGEVVGSGPVRWRHVAVGKVGEHPLKLETLLFRDQARIEFRLTCHWRGGDGFLAALWPTPIEGALETDVNFGAEIKDLDAVKYGTIEGHLSNNIERMREGAFYARSFVSVSDGTRGVTHVSQGGDRYYIRDEAEGTIAHILVNSVRPVQSGWEKHVNYQRDALARHTFNWSLIFHEGDWRAAGMARVAAALRQAPEVLRAHGAPEADLPARHSFMSIEPANVVLSAFYQEGEATLLRVWETAGRGCEMVVELPFAPLTAAVVDLNGDWLPEEAPPVLEGARLKLPLRSWQVATVQLMPNPAGEWPH